LDEADREGAEARWADEVRVQACQQIRETGQ
jgi:hypothetical protein